MTEQEKKIDQATKDWLLKGFYRDKHEEALKDERYASAYGNTSFSPGRKLYLEVEVSDQFLSSGLMGWLYQQDRDEDVLPFGCKLLQIRFDGKTAKELKNDLIQFLSNYSL